MAYVSYISGPVIKASLEGESVNLLELAYIGTLGLIGEVVELGLKSVTIQVYEQTDGLKLKEKVDFTGEMLCATLGPGLLGNVFDGIQRPLYKIDERIENGLKIEHLDSQQKWELEPLVKEGDSLKGGEIVARVKENSMIHKIVFPYDTKGVVKTIVKKGIYTIEDTILSTTEGFELKLHQKHPVRIPKSYKKRLHPEVPLITGQRIIDFLFPVVKGGTSSIPGGFGTGKTILQQTLAKLCDADIIVYIGCGERGNEMTEVLEEFPLLDDVHKGTKLIDRTILIANTSDMPVSAREASIFLGLTIAEYYRDMGYHVALMADSTSRWAEAMRELSSRMNELPVEEGYPAYLASKIASVYERAGIVKTHSNEVGSLTMIGAVSPAGGDMSEPVTRHTRRYTGTFWALDKELASARFYPAINYTMSYSSYIDNIKEFWISVDKNADELYKWCIELLQEDEKLQKIVKLLGSESLPEEQKLIVEIGDIIKEVFLQQNSFDDIDMYSTPQRSIVIIKIIRTIENMWRRAIEEHNIPIHVLKEQDIISKFVQSKYSIRNEELVKVEELEGSIIKTYEDIMINYGL